MISGYFAKMRIILKKNTIIGIILEIYEYC